MSAAVESNKTKSNHSGDLLRAIHAGDHTTATRICRQYNIGLSVHGERMHVRRKN